MTTGGAGQEDRAVHSTFHRPLCTIELIAEDHAERCPGEACAFWVDGCVLERIESDLQDNPAVAELLLELRRTIEAGTDVPLESARDRLQAALGVAGERAGPAGGSTELV
jgi:hypothetical protein